MRETDRDQGTARTRRWLATTLTLAMLLTGTPLGAATAAGDEEEAGLVVEGLLGLGVAFGGVTTLPPLATALPMTAVSIRDVLELDRLVAERISAAVTGQSRTLDTLDDVVSRNDDGMELVEAVPGPDAPVGAREWILSLDVTQDLPVPLRYRDEDLRFGTAELDGELAARIDGSFRVRYDPGADPLLRVSVVGEQLFDVTAWTRATDSTSTAAAALTAPPFSAVTGFVEASVTGTAVADVAVQLRMRDPNGRGAITREDLEFGIAEDLFTITPPADDAVAVTFSLTSGLLPDGPHGTVSAVDRGIDPAPDPDEPVSPWPAVLYEPDPELERLSSVTAAQSLGAFASFTAAMLRVEGAVDVDLPMLDARLTDVFSPGLDLASIVTEQATARIVCGAADTVPPSGAPLPGRPQYCQAVTEGLDADPGSVVWSALSASTTVTPPASGTTVAGTPTANVTVETTVGFPHLVVDFTVDGEPRRARSVIGSVETLGAVLDEAGLTGAVAYDAGAGAIEVALTVETPDATVPVATGGAEGLGPVTGLSGLCAALVAGDGQRSCPQTGQAPGATDTADLSTGTVDVTATGRAVGATLGIGLLPTDAGLDVEPEVYVRPGAGGAVWRIDTIDALLTAPAPMSGRIGFLQVDVDLTAFDLRTVGAGPAVLATVPTEPFDLYDDDARPVNGAVRVSRLLSREIVDADGSTEEGEGAPELSPTVARAIAVDADVAVRDAPTDAGDRLVDASGALTATWTDLRPDALPTATTDAGYDDLRLFDLVPTSLGVVSAVAETAGGVVLTLPTMDLFRDLGVTAAMVGTPAATMDRRALRRGDEAGCTEFSVLSATTLRCDDPIELDQVWASGDLLEIEGNPDALRDGLVADLSELISAFETLDPEKGADATFPLLDARPIEVSHASTNVANAIAQVLGEVAAEGPADAGRGPLSTLQRFLPTFGGYIGTGVTPVVLLVDRDGAPHLDLELTTTAGNPAETKALRIMAGDRLLGLPDTAGEPVEVVATSSSSARLRLAVDLEAGTTEVHDVSSVTAGITGLSAASPAKIATDPAEYGAADWTTGPAADIQLAVGVQQRIALPATAATWTPLSEVRGLLEPVRSGTGSPNTCGISGAPAGAVACAVVPLAPAPGEAATNVVEVALGPDDSSGGDGGPLLGDQPLAVRFLGDGFAFLARGIAEGLDGNAIGQYLPLVGADLDAGAGVEDDLVAFSTEVRRRLPQDVDEAQNLAAFLAEVTTAVRDGAAAAGFDPVVADATATCTGPCPTDNPATDDVDESATVSDAVAVEMPLVLTMTDTTEAPLEVDPVEFASGLPGAELHSTLEVETSVPTWTATATIGIRRGTGPYVTFPDTPGNDPVELLSVEVEAALPEAAADGTVCHAWTRVPSTTTDVPASIDESGARCLDAVVGYLPSVLVDRGDTGLDATVVLTVPEDAADVEHFLPALVDGLDLTTTATGVGGLDVYFEGWASELGFFDVLGVIDLDWSDGAYGDDLAFSGLHLDVGSVYRALGPAFKEASEWLRTIQPVLDALSAPIPVATDLSKMAGGPDITLLSMVVAGGGDVEMVANLLTFRTLAEQLTGTEGAEVVPLGKDAADGASEPGAFSVASDAYEFVSCTNRIKDRTDADAGAGSNGTCSNPASSKKNRTEAEKKERAKPKKEGENRGRKMQKSSKSPILSTPSVGMPIFADARASYDLILARGNSTLVTVDLGTLGAEFGVDRAFGPFMVGPIPIFANIGGSVALAGRFSFGFDSDGLTRVLATEDQGDVVSLAAYDIDMVKEGFYIDDLNGGVDVPEITLVFTMYAGASVSIGIVTAGLRGGAELDLLLDAHDPDKDGLIRIHEFAGSSGRSCAFNVSSGLTFFLDLFFTVDLVIKRFGKSWRVLQSPRIELFDFKCANETPTLAFPRVTTLADGTTRSELVLTAGEHRPRRNAFLTEDKERYTVRQLTSVPDEDGKVHVEVSAFQLTQLYKVLPGTTIIADGGAGDDAFRFHPGHEMGETATGETTVQTVPFGLPVRVTAGDDKDRIEGGDGDDRLEGGNGEDTISGGLGNDWIDGGEQDDVIDAGPGDDTVLGKGGVDAIATGPGADIARGGGDADRITGGPAIDPGSLFLLSDLVEEIDPVTNVRTLFAPQLDGGDLLVGEDGSDDVDGGHGSDIVVGGDYSGTATIERAVRRLTVVDVDGSLSERDVEYSTVRLPTEEQIRAECATPGEPSGSRDDVSGGFDRDYLVGGGGADQLAGGADGDLLCGRGGDDLLLGEGDDVLPDETGRDELLGGPGNDRLYGGADVDTLDGGDGDDLLRGESGDDLMAGGRGADLLLGGAGRDTLRGDTGGAASTDVGDGRDIRCAIETTIIDGRFDITGDLSGNGADDGRLEGLAVVDGLVRDVDGSLYSGMLGPIVVVEGHADIDGDGNVDGAGAGDNGIAPIAHVSGAVGDGDCIFGGDGAEVLIDGQEGGDRIDAGAGDDQDVRGGSGNDLVRGGPGIDHVLGGADDDLVVGDSGDDYVAGGQGNDRVRGGAGDDLLLGGSPRAGVPDGNDVLLGDRGNDVLAGGNALLVAHAPGSAVPKAGVTLLATPVGPPSDNGWDDELYGGFDDDWAFGQEGDDLVRGGHDDDVVEGGPGNDRVQGDDHDDLVVGGSSTSGPMSPDRDATGVPDGDDVLLGDGGVDDLDGVDVIVGDNARLDPDVGVDRARWPGVRPRVGIVLFDVPTSAAPGGPYGNDTIDAGDGDDLVLGQSGDDVITGNGGADAIEGNAGSDTIHGDLGTSAPRGDQGDDAILGGSWTAGTLDASGVGAGDVLHGDGGDDTLLGDNGTVLATVTLLDVPAVGSDGVPGRTAGDDTLYGDAGLDALFGQSGDDVLRGGDDDDALEGGAGSDELYGDDDDDTLVGGGSAVDGRIVPTRLGDGLPDAGDLLVGGDGDDVLAGDNARLVRQAGLRADGTRLRFVLLFDVHLAGDRAPSGGGGADLLYGNGGRDLVFGQGGDDEAHGGAGDDVVEGNAGDDEVAGDGGQDDVLGGGSATDGMVIGGNVLAVVDRLLMAPSGLVAGDAAGLADGADRVFGGSMDGGRLDGIQQDSHDVLLGDNGRITRPGGDTVLDGGTWSPRVVRVVAMADLAPGETAGSDVLYGQAGDDDLYGQHDDSSTGGRARDTVGGVVVAGDLLDGGDGDDALVGDLGVDTPTPASAIGPEREVVSKGGFVDETILQTGSLVRVVELVASEVGGHDVLRGGAGRDSLHAGAGDDHADGGSGEDAVFGADGDDALWGGTDHDRIYGGLGEDNLDVKPRSTDSPLWWAVAPPVDTDGDPSTINGFDLLYGGFDADALQADVGDAGQVAGDRLLDWVGAFNVYYVCDSGYGAGRVQRKPDPTTLDALRLLAEADGAFAPATSGSSGWHELRLVTTADNKQNNNPRHPDHPGSDNCEG